MAELINQEAGSSTEIELKVFRNEIQEYTYTWQGTQVSSQKVQIVLQSKNAEQYCVGVAILQKEDKTELKTMADRLSHHRSARGEGAGIATEHALPNRHQCQQLPSPMYYN